MGFAASFNNYVNLHRGVSSPGVVLAEAGIMFKFRFPFWHPDYGGPSRHANPIFLNKDSAAISALISPTTCASCSSRKTARRLLSRL